MAHVGTLNRLGSTFAPLSNWLLSMPGSAWLHEKLLGIDRRRPMPRFERDNFQKWFKRHSAAGGVANAQRGPIVLLDDCLTSYCEPNVNRAAVQVLVEVVVKPRRRDRPDELVHLLVVHRRQVYQPHDPADPHAWRQAGLDVNVRRVVLDAEAKEVVKVHCA